MEYRNRLPPEGINTPGRHPFKEFLRLALFAILALASVGLLLNYAGGHLGGIVPFEVESWLITKVDSAVVKSGEESPFKQDVIDTPLEKYLNKMAFDVQSALGIEEPVSITLHYSDEDTFNAYATLGGHVTLFRGLLKALPHENALAMLMAHEFSHVQLRHPARGVGGGLAVAVGTVLLPGSLPDSRFYSLTSQLTSMKFSRQMESDADEKGLAAVQNMYGHVNGADDLFILFMQEQEQEQSRSGVLDSFFSTHPLDTARVEFIRVYSTQNDWALEGELTRLPDDWEEWLQ